MKNNKAYIYGSLLALPFVGILYYFVSPTLNPPQCPINYTQEQVDASSCIVGANIGGIPLLIAGAVVTWFAAVWLVSKVSSKRDSK